MKGQYKTIQNCNTGNGGRDFRGGFRLILNKTATSTGPGHTFPPMAKACITYADAHS